MPTDRIKFLVKLYFDKTINDSQLAELSEWVKGDVSDEELAELLENAWSQQSESIAMPEVLSDNIISSILKSTPSESQEEDSNKIVFINKSRWWLKRFVIAASLLIVCSIGYFTLRPTSSNAPSSHVKNTRDEVIRPGGSKATLTLSDGSKIILDSAGNGLITRQGGANVIKLANGQLQYSGSQNTTSETVYNTMSTPVGGIYEVVLPDGSKAWLNSASSITYPTSFTGNRRSVQITGEAYFEVAHDKAKPFHVSVKGMDVEVLGTHFNINAYDNESSIRTTLLQGRVKVSQGNSSILISPGEQAVAGKSANELSIKKDGIDLEEVVAWKNGKFMFLDDNIRSIMRQIERWYGVKVTYDENVTSEEFVGVISRNVNISQILDMLEKSGRVRFTIQNRNIIVQ